MSCRCHAQIIAHLSNKAGVSRLNFLDTGRASIPLDMIWMSLPCLTNGFTRGPRKAGASWSEPLFLRQSLVGAFPVTVAVGTTFADRPPRRSVRARLRIRLLPLMNNGENADRASGIAVGKRQTGSYGSSAGLVPNALVGSCELTNIPPVGARKRPESWIPALWITKWLRGSDLN